LSSCTPPTTKDRSNATYREIVNVIYIAVPEFNSGVKIRTTCPTWTGYMTGALNRYASHCTMLFYRPCKVRHLRFSYLIRYVVAKAGIELPLSVQELT